MNDQVARMIAAAAVSLFLGGTASAEDWPTFMGPHHDWTSHDTGLANAWPKEGPRLVWENKNIACGFGSPVVAGGKVFVISREIDPNVKDKNGNFPPWHEAKCLPGPDVLSCLDRDTGKALWTHDFNNLTSTATTAWNTPTVEGDRLYARGGDGQVRCISTVDGKTIWAWPKEGEKPFAGPENNKLGLSIGESTAAAVIICDDLVILLAGHRNWKCVFAGLNKRTGEKVWEHAAGSWLHGAQNLVELDLGTRKVVAAQYEILDPKTGEKLCAASGPIGANSFWCRAGKGNLLYSSFQRKKGNNHGEGIVCEKFEVKPDGTVGCTEVWRWKPAMSDDQAAEDRIEKGFGGPLVVGEHLFVSMGRKGGGDGFYCLDAATGSETWPGFAKAWHGYISPLYVDGKIYYADMRGTLSMFAADPKQYQSLGAAKVLDPSWCTAAIADGRLFYRGLYGNLKCLDLRADMK